MKEKEARVFQNTVFWIFWPFLLFVWEIQSDKAARMPTGIRRFLENIARCLGFRYLCAARSKTLLKSVLIRKQTNWVNRIKAGELTISLIIYQTISDTLRL